MNSSTGKILILVGIAILLTGIVIYFFHDKLLAWEFTRRYKD